MLDNDEKGHQDPITLVAFITYDTCKSPSSQVVGGIDSSSTTHVIPYPDVKRETMSQDLLSLLT